MYLHIGSETILSEQDIIGIFDLENTSISKFTREFLRARQQNHAVITVAEDIPKSFVVVSPKKSYDGSFQRHTNIRETVYLSQLAAATLRRRASGNGISEDKKEL